MNPKINRTKEDAEYFARLQMQLINFLKPYHDRLDYLYSIAPPPGYYVYSEGRIEQLPLKKEWQYLTDDLNQEINDFIARYWDNI